MSLLSSEQLQEAIEKYAKDSTSILLASAYITDTAVNHFEGIFSKCSSVQIIVRGRLNDFISGSSTISALKSLLELGCSIKLNENLHAKIYLFDRETILVGSSNFTARGIVLSAEGNIEANTKIEADEESLAFIGAVWDSSIDITYEKLALMDEYLSSIDSKENILNLTWPEEVFEEPVSELFVEDFPSNPQGSNKDASNKYSVIDFSIEQGDFEHARKLFSMLRLTKWFLKQLKEHGEIRYGQLSKLMHTDLVEDPRVYRKDLKLMQSNFLEYVDRLLPEVETFRPNHSQLFSLKRC